MDFVPPLFGLKIGNNHVTKKVFICFPALGHCTTGILWYNLSHGCPRCNDLCDIRSLHCLPITGFLTLHQLISIALIRISPLSFFCPC